MKTPTALDLPTLDPLPESTEKYFKICQEKLGMVPNVLQAHAFDIAKLNAFTGLYNELMLADSGLSKLEREMIAVVVSSINRCFYCLTAHGAAVRELSGKPILGEQLVMNYRTAELEPRQRAMLDLRHSSRAPVIPSRSMTAERCAMLVLPIATYGTSSTSPRSLT